VRGRAGGNDGADLDPGGRWNAVDAGELAPRGQDVDRVHREREDRVVNPIDLKALREASGAEVHRSDEVEEFGRDELLREPERERHRPDLRHTPLVELQDRLGVRRVNEERQLDAELIVACPRTDPLPDDVHRHRGCAPASGGELLNRLLDGPSLDAVYRDAFFDFHGF
jgi:hypothetical protein